MFIEFIYKDSENLQIFIESKGRNVSIVLEGALNVSI